MRKPRTYVQAYKIFLEHEEIEELKVRKAEEIRKEPRQEACWEIVFPWKKKALEEKKRPNLTSN